MARTLAAPVALDIQTHNPAATFGTGFAPFFLPLALFIGALIIWMLLKPLQSRPVVNGLGALRVVLASYWPALLIVFCQVVVMYVVVHFGVGLQAKYPLATVAFLFLVAGTFLALIQAFNALFGVSVGRVVTLAFLMLQLVSAGGIYPVETTAKPFQILHPVDPMTYAVNGLRQLIVGGIDSRLWIAIAVLVGVSGGLAGRQFVGGAQGPAVHDGPAEPAHRGLTSDCGVRPVTVDVAETHTKSRESEPDAPVALQPGLQPLLAGHRTKRGQLAGDGGRQPLGEGPWFVGGVGMFGHDRVGDAVAQQVDRANPLRGSQFRGVARCRGTRWRWLPRAAVGPASRSRRPVPGRRGPSPGQARRCPAPSAPTPWACSA